MIAGFTAEEILHEVLVAPRAALIPLPDTQIIERPGWWQLVTPSLARGGMNEVTCTEMTDDEADATIDQTLAFYRGLDIRFRWMVPPGTKPADLAERLERRGLQRSESLVMACATSSAVAESAPSITVDAVTLASVDDYTRIMAEGWGADPAALDPLHRKMLADPAGRNHLFLARHEGAPAAVGSYIALDRSAYLIGAVTLATHRGHGLYRALVNARMRHAAGRGLRLATSLASATTSAPILTRLGFETVCSIGTLMNA
ncbi:MAG: GNAT family N-acetyltransferase [Byssovorax sp.]